MAPDSFALQLLALAVAVGSAVALGLFWERARIWLRTLTAVLCTVSAAAGGLVWVNRQVETYPTWASLAGSTTATAAAPVVDDTGGGTGGRITSFTVAGPASGMTMPVYAYLPPGYDSSPTTRYPVIEALHGYPSSPLQWINGLHIARVLDTEIAAGRMAPTVVLFPYQTTNIWLDTECTNLTGGPQAETFLTVDVPAAARARLHVRSDPAAWGLTGYSAGGYCATDLALRHPNKYAAAASLSGYAEPGITVGNGTQDTTYNDVWRLKHLPQPAVALYLATTRTDRGSLRDTLALAHAAHAPMSVTTDFVTGGGHNTQSWAAMEAPAFDWLSTTLARPVTPAPAAPAGV